ncbi:tetratricopeptide repeat protein [Wenzhouxiangella sp. XN201]|uniref:YfgM family protein n=1 Tax=Wenzhouxiangella sp. XN201 TaxID=2710755 RepID=UPI0013CC9A2B|nr:tetratricopeptide repeat protein [Wenzhouxiangella sp. XN201]NEZ04012.1 tetratricopeptide repeat protein [Wenzhouxiangella sp. XN201]
MAVELYDEHEQSERVRNWIKEYSSSIIIALILAFGSIFGFRQWQDYQANQQALAADYYRVVADQLSAEEYDVAAAEYEAMREAVGGSAYAGLAGMRLAAAQVENGRLAPAESIYREILDNRRLRPLWPVATLRLTRVLEAQGESEAALALLDEPAPTGFEAAWAETRGDLMFERGRVEEARSAWQQARESRLADGSNTRLLDVKIDAATAATGETS